MVSLASTEVSRDVFLLTCFSWTVNVPFQSFFLQGCDLCVVWFPQVNVLQAFAVFCLFLPGIGRGWGRFWNLPLLGRFAVFNYKGDLREDRVCAPCSPSSLPRPRQASVLGHKQPQPFTTVFSANIITFHVLHVVSLVPQMVKNPPAMWEIWV